jgi:hypothetical protein
VILVFDWRFFGCKYVGLLLFRDFGCTSQMLALLFGSHLILRGHLSIPIVVPIEGDGAVWNFLVENYFIWLEPEDVVCLAILGFRLLILLFQ